MALKEEKSRLGISLDGNATLRRNAVAKQTNGPMSDLQKMRRQNVDSGYSTSDGYDKRWLEDGTTAANGTPSNGAPSNGTPLNGTPPNGAASNGTPSTTATDSGTAAKWSTPSSSAPNQPAAELSTPNLSPVTQNNNNIDEYIRPNVPIDNSTPKRGAATTISNKTNNNRFVARAQLRLMCAICAFSSMASMLQSHYICAHCPFMLHHIANHFTSRNTSICQFHPPPSPIIIYSPHTHAFIISQHDIWPINIYENFVVFFCFFFLPRSTIRNFCFVVCASLVTTRLRTAMSREIVKSWATNIKP